MTSPREPLPQAVVRPVRRSPWVWILPLLALAFAIYLGASAWGDRGIALVVHARDGHGIRAGDPLLYRGIAVGEVGSVELAPGLDGVVLGVQLDWEARGLARTGSRFWVVRPHIGLERISGLETILGARHLGVLPGPPDGAPQREFEALGAPPVEALDDGEGLEVVLEGPRRYGLAPGAPITFRGFRVGTVLSIGLTSDATAVEARVRIWAPYRQLVRQNTRFWETGGLELSLGVTGLSVDLDSVGTLLTGGVAMATPTNPGAEARNGHRFRVAGEPDEDWLEWSPALALGTGLLPDGAPRPTLLYVRTVWEAGMFSRTRSREGWVLPLASGVVGPLDLLVPEEDAKEPALEVRGERLPLSPGPDRRSDWLAFRELRWPGAVSWPAERVRALTEPEDCLVIADPGRTDKAVSAARLWFEDDAWQIDPAIAFDADWHGAAVLARSDGFLVGILGVDGGLGRIASVKALLRPGD